MGFFVPGLFVNLVRNSMNGLTRMKIYRIITSEKGIKDLEEKVSNLINKGWKLAGSMSFNHGYPYQPLITEQSEGLKAINKKQDVQQSKQLGANEAMKQLDDLT